MKHQDDRGVILIALLWILTALSIIALSFSRESFVEVAVARNSRDLESAYFAARAGMEVSIYRLCQKRFVPRVQQLQLDAAPNPLDMGKLNGTLGDFEYNIDIQEETGKINLNFVSEEQLRALVAAVGIPKQDGDVIVDSILDWRDVDKDHRINGAEDDYYQALNPPYSAKNGRIDTVEELLLVRGVTAEYFYGRPAKTEEGTIVYRYGLARCLTVYSTSNRVNINFAPLPVLMSVPGMNPEMAKMIYDRRKVKPFTTLEEITKTLSVTLGAMTLPFLSTDQTFGIYTLTASAHRVGSKVQRVIRAVVSLDQSQKNFYRVLYWNESVPDYEGIKS